ncbi:MAG: M24 family metallopeptidase [Thermoanaerobaculia bacterium]
MLTRRHVLASAGAAAALGFSPAPPVLAATKAPPLPPPLKPEVFRERQSRLRAAARARNLDAIVVTPCANLTYAANLSIGRSERLTALLLPTDGPAVLVTPSFEEANHRRDAVVDDVKTWQEDEDPIALASSALSGKKAIGIEGSTPYATAGLLAAATGAKLEDATPLFDPLRRIKSPEEQAFITEAARRTNLAISATHKRLRRGMTEGDLEGILEQEYARLGLHGGGLVQFGPSAAFPHGAPGERALSKGDVVLIDSGCKIHGYTSDVTRTVCFGEPSEELRKVHRTVQNAQTAGIEALKAGQTGQDVDRAARRVIEEAGYGEFFTHRLGHGLGLDGHEPPYLVRGNRTPLEVGNTVTIEPGIYIPGKFGVRIEDDYAVTTGIPGSLSVRPLDLEVIPA